MASVDQDGHRSSAKEADVLREPEYTAAFQPQKMEELLIHVGESGGAIRAVATRVLGRECLHLRQGKVRVPHACFVEEMVSATPNLTEPHGAVS